MVFGLEHASHRCVVFADGIAMSDSAPAQDPTPKIANFFFDPFPAVSTFFGFRLHNRI